ncbi:hypothetical protein D3C77_548650 [compost metagenome]
MIMRIPLRRKSSSISSTLDSSARSPSRRVTVAHSIKSEMSSALLIIFCLTNNFLNNFGIFFNSEEGKPKKRLAAVPTKIMTYAAGLLTRLTIGAPLRNIPRTTATKPRIIPMSDEISIIHLVLELN